MRVLVLLILLFAAFAEAADYTVQTDNARREAALQAEAQRMSMTPSQVLQFFINNLLDLKIGEQERNRANRLSNAWDKFTAQEKKALVDALTRVEAQPD